MCRHLVPLFFGIMGGCLGSTLPAAAQDVTTRESWSFNTRRPNDLQVAVYSLENSSWTKEMIQERIRRANEALKTCNYEIAFVDYFQLKTDFRKIRVDDYDAEYFPDGMKKLSQVQNSFSADFNLFYFEDYVIPFSSAGTFPLAFPANYKNLPPTLVDTAWFPYQTSAQRQKRVLPYSEEAHELGHLLLRQGHDTSGVANIMADNSKMRTNSFSASQCERFIKPLSRQVPKSCQSLYTQLQPLFFKHYETYNPGHYMAQWCVRNSQNLYRTLAPQDFVKGKVVHAVYMIHKDEQSSLKPRMARWKAASWSNHAFLIFDGLVLDQDFTDGPAILPLDAYIQKMWGEAANDSVFQVRNAQDIEGYTNLEVRHSFKSQKFPVMDLKGLLQKFATSPCALSMQQL